MFPCTLLRRLDFALESQCFQTASQSHSLVGQLEKRLFPSYLTSRICTKFPIFGSISRKALGSERGSTLVELMLQNHVPNSVTNKCSKYYSVLKWVIHLATPVHFGHHSLLWSCSLDYLLIKGWSSSAFSFSNIHVSRALPFLLLLMNIIFSD